MVLVLTLAPAQAQQGTPGSSQQQWADFNHYVLIARPDLAKAAGDELLKLEGAALLQIVENSDYATRYQETLRRAARTAGLEETAKALSAKILDAQIGQARDAARIAADIELLDDGARPVLNATVRLKAAGQYAAPQLLAALLDENKSSLHPYVMPTMVSIGRPMVYPLSVSLPYLEPRPLTQVAQVLAEIGYPLALPYLKQVIDNPKIDANARAVVQAAYDRLANQAAIPSSATSDDLFLQLARNFYTNATVGGDLPGYDEQKQVGIVWRFNPGSGLYPTAVPGAIFGDVLAMRASSEALALNPKLDAALSLWLAANVRREQRLPQGEKDQSYPGSFQGAEYYLLLAGPLRQHDVLAMALDNRDAQQSVSAINALRSTANQEALLTGPNQTQPLLRSLYYPDRRVRILAAQALANIRPREAFAGSERVVRSLAEAVRPSDVQYALVIAADQESINQINGEVQKLNYQPVGALSLDEASSRISNVPGVDLIVVSAGTDAFLAMYRTMTQDDRLAAVPTVVITSEAGVIEVNRRFDRATQKPMAISSQSGASLAGAVDQAIKATAGKAMTSEQSTKLALDSLSALRDIAVSRSAVFNIADAQPALMRALSDSRAEVATGAAGVLAMIDNAEAQQAIAEAGLDGARAENLRIALLNSLADSANAQGNKLTGPQLDKVLDLVKKSQGDLAVAAARAHGALSLPSANALELITQK
ncbi:MAG: hypothetical protein WD042_19040 [Phycisphaeraceae bacterium]